MQFIVKFYRNTERSHGENVYETLDEAREFVQRILRFPWIQHTTIEKSWRLSDTF